MQPNYVFVITVYQPDVCKHKPVHGCYSLSNAHEWIDKRAKRDRDECQEARMESAFFSAWPSAVRELPPVEHFKALYSITEVEVTE